MGWGGKKRRKRHLQSVRGKPRRRGEVPTAVYDRICLEIRYIKVEEPPVQPGGDARGNPVVVQIEGEKWKLSKGPTRDKEERKLVSSR
jgi:hypothetical protein